MRKDALGFFWKDEPVIKVKKEVVKVTPPEPTWLLPDYLPYLEEARQLKGLSTVESAYDLYAHIGQELSFDIECYPNYFLIGFRLIGTDIVYWLEAHDGDALTPKQIEELRWLLNNFPTVGFNSSNYDIPITTLAMNGFCTEDLQEATDDIISKGIRWRDVLKWRGVKRIDSSINHIDLIEVAPLRANLKIYGARAHIEQLQDLPFQPGIELTDEQKEITRFYCLAKDLASTGKLREILNEQIKIRIDLGSRYNMDLRSRSDAQIAERIITHQIEKMTGERISRPTVEPGTWYNYIPTDYMQFQTPYMQSVLRDICSVPFVVGYDGAVGLPQQLKDLKIQLGKQTYQLGIGGLHSTEKKQAVVATKGYRLVDLDVTSFYPMMILNRGLFPRHLGPIFLYVFEQIVRERIAAKENGLTAIANALKIVINGTFGKFGSPYSNVYSPELLIMTTITGQLVLLLLIEMLELKGLKVISANTDGIVVHYHESQEATLNEVRSQWEAQTKLNLEDTHYLALLSRDVNSYIAVKRAKCKTTNEWLPHADGVKGKGAYANPWSSAKNKELWLTKNPTTTVCIDAIEAFLTKGIPLRTHIEQCTDFTKFVAVRSVTGGAVKVWDEHNEYLGKSIRWYYGKDIGGHIVYAKTGKKVPVTEGAVPVMDLPEAIPSNIDSDWYVAQAEKMLAALGYA